MNQRNTLKKTERLKSRKRIEKLFREGKSFSLYPFKIIYLLTAPGSIPAASGSIPAPAPIQAGFGVSSRLFGKAVDRNRIKRLCREAWRLQRQPLSGQVQQKGLSMAVFIIYTGKQLPDYPTVTQKIGVALQRLMKETA
jgi:ribonuclease P protein component